MAKKKAKLSWREQRGQELGITKEAYSASKEGQAVKKSKKYYTEKEGFTKKKAKLEVKGLKQDFENVLREAGIEKTRTEEDYVRNMENLSEDKSADVEDLNYYKKTQTGRTQEDLDVSLQKEARRYGLEQEKLNESIQGRGLTYSSLPGGGIRGKEQGEVDVTHETEVADVSREASRSFADINRYEFVKNREIETKYGRAEEKEGTDKSRTLQDWDEQVRKSKQTKKLGEEKVRLGKREDLWDIDYSKDTNRNQISQMFDKNNLWQKYEAETWNTLGA